MFRSITLCKGVGPGGWNTVGFWVCACAALVACQQLGRHVGPPTPTIGLIPAVTHETQVTLSGTKSSGSAIIVNDFQRVAPNDSTVWTAAVDLLTEGSNRIVLAAMDDLGNLSGPLTVIIQRDSSKPSPPTISMPATSPATSATNPVTLAGTKEANSFIRLNGRRITAASNDTTWTYQATVSPGFANTLTVTAVDAAGNESDPVTVLVTLTGACVAPPRPIFPLDNGAVQWGRAFSWTPQAGAASYRFELSASPAFDAFAVPPTLDITDTLLTPTTDPPTPGVYYWRVGAVDASCVAYGRTRKVIIGSTTGDVTGDGFADVFVGASGDDQADRDAGAAYLFHGGSAQNLLFDAVVTGQGRAPAFGTAVAKAGDIDRDGFVDLLVGSYLADRDESANDNTGAAYLYWGGASLASSPALTLRGEADQSFFGVSVAGIGDVNGDDYPDIAVGAYRTPVTASCAGATTTLAGVGRVYVFLGKGRGEIDAIPDIVFTGETTEIPGDPSSACRQGDEFGLRVAGSGDVNGDGYDDLVVGARGYDFGTDPAAGQNAGRAYVFFGGPWLAGVGAERANVILTGIAAGDEFGATVAGAGDTDGDGFADLLVGAPLRDLSGPDSGSVTWYFGRGPGVSGSPLEMSGAAGDNFGGAVASAGDIDGDGLADVVVGAYLAGPTDNGAAVYFKGNTNPTGVSAATIVGEPEPEGGDQFGLAVAGVGDVDGDGIDDTAVGAWRHDVCFNPSRPFCDDAGRAYIIPGPQTTNRVIAPDSVDWVFTGLNPGDGLGVSVR